MWQTQEAKAKFSQLLKATLQEGDQLISSRGELVAVMISKQRYEDLTRPQGSLIDFFKKAPLQKIELKIERNRELPRDIIL